MGSDILKRTTPAYSIAAGGAVAKVTQETAGSWVKILRDKSLNLQVEISESSIKKYVENLAAKYAVSPVSEVTYQFYSGKPDVVAAAGKDGRQVSNTAEVAAELTAAVQAGQNYQGTFKFKTVKFGRRIATIRDSIRRGAFTYSVRTLGTVYSSLSQLAALAAETYADSRGWNRAGVTLTQVSSGGNFELILASSSKIAEFNGCSFGYSCRWGDFVLINDDRWRFGTSTWNGSGGSLRDYRHMVINHETGHWLGLGHFSCPAPGALAPVMQQQSVNLQGCKINPWPTPAEI